MLNLVAHLAQELKLKDFQVANTVKLLVDEGCTVPFVARYRKEQTGSLDEVQLRQIIERHTYISELESNKERYLKVVAEYCAKSPELQAKFPELKAKFEACQSKQALEDLYLPFKPKRRTRAQVAKEKGLEPLSQQILAEATQNQNLEALAEPFVTAGKAEVEPQLQVKSVKEALEGASDILAEILAETAELRALVRRLSFDSGYITSKAIDAELLSGEKAGEAPEDKGPAKKKKGDAQKYQNYFNYREPVLKALPHRIMAVRRGEAEKVLRVVIEVDAERVLSELFSTYLESQALKPSETVRVWLKGMTEDAYKRLLSPAIETEIRLELKNQGEAEAIRVFAENLANLLLLPPIAGKTVLGVDPGLRTGSKLAVVDETGKLLVYTTVYPDFGKGGAKTEKAKAEILKMLTEHKVNCLAIGNGTGSREIDQLISSVIRENQVSGIKRVIVNEAGASVYSTDDIAREEFPDLDPTIRSTVSIARRLQDPLAELVKIDPKSIGVGQYQHDVNVTKLKNSLEAVVESCVNRVGVNLNTASHKLLSYVSGIGPALAKQIVHHREQGGKFHSRQALLEVSGFGPKAFEQAAGFIRVPESQHPLDNSAVHPERYAIVERIAQDLGKPLDELIGKSAVVEAIPLEKYVDAEVGMPTLRDIATELIKPGRDPRSDGDRLLFSDEVSTLEDLKAGMVLKGTVTNVTNFGAFVDIGVHQDGLVHLSELAEQFVNDPSKVVQVGQVVDVRILDVDIKRKRIALSRRLQPRTNEAPRPPREDQRRGPPPQGASRQGAPREGRGGPQRPPAHPQREPLSGGRERHRQAASSAAPQNKAQGSKGPQFTLEDLMNKFNTKR